jgi:S1-C subfamily serine protease
VGYIPWWGEGDTIERLACIINIINWFRCDPFIKGRRVKVINKNRGTLTMKSDLDLCGKFLIEVEAKSNPSKWLETLLINIIKVTLRIKVLLLFVVFVLTYASITEAQIAREVAQKTLPSVVLLMMQDANGQLVSLGSGFFVRDDIIATNLHVIKNAVKGYVKPVGLNTKYQIKGIVGIDKSQDLVILLINGIKSPLLNIGDCKTQKVGDAIYVAGNPLGLEGTFSQGIISGIRQVGPDFLFQITAPISPGSSGGPLLNEKGEVIGVAVAAFKGGQNLNFAIPSSYLISLLSNPLSDPKPIAQIREGRPLKQKKGIVNTLTEDTDKVILGHHLIWDDIYSSKQYKAITGNFTFSIINKMDKPIKNIYCLIVFRDKSRSVVDSKLIEYSGVIPPGAAKRLNGKVDRSVQDMADDYTNPHPVEFRILQFEIEE